MPLGNLEYMKSIGIPESNMHVRDWWEESLFTISLPSSSIISASEPYPEEENTKKEVTKPDKSDLIQTSFKLTCTPGQHVANRGPFDRWKSLWASWVVEEVIDKPEHNEQIGEQVEGSANVTPKKVYFAGDTGYRTLIEGESEDNVPVCPAFKEIGEKFGSFDLALIPIG